MMHSSHNSTLAVRYVRLGLLGLRLFFLVLFVAALGFRPLFFIMIVMVEVMMMVRLLSTTGNPILFSYNSLLIKRLDSCHRTVKWLLTWARKAQP